MATHIAVTNVEFSCSFCIKKHTEPRRNKDKGCSGALRAPVAKYKDKLVFYKCPSNFYSPYVAELMGHARHLESGLLPYSGGLFDQPAKLIELFNQINGLRLEDEIDRAKKASDRAKKEAKKQRR